ncbi:4Fe-4S dicluster domain-containing protein [Pelotalea chapellei]|uniref:4Fe-4S dicluster domain-containing protein n=1 Tax=Pelotalea chapellei TaxID=44671 RepID=A0ABS5UAV7_9BACT|nr:4Fe-4S dicluster domain-containing protein [Pelotalea chapellei]MBT1072817.1 4Fe-4S dicluster domain-containing protein [Pelotalea chapellei]
MKKGCCSGCGRCVAACAEKILTLEVSGYRKHAAMLDTSRCTSCGACTAACPLDAISCGRLQIQ